MPTCAKPVPFVERSILKPVRFVEEAVQERLIWLEEITLASKFVGAGGVGMGVGVGVDVGDGVGVATAVEDTSFEGALSGAAPLYAVTTKKYVRPTIRFDANVDVVFPSSMIWV